MPWTLGAVLFDLGGKGEVEEEEKYEEGFLVFHAGAVCGVHTVPQFLSGLRRVINEGFTINWMPQTKQG